MGIHVDFISYSGVRPKEFHPYSQLVLVMKGGMEMEVDGKVGKLDEGCGAFVAPGIVHSQLAEKENRFLLLNCAKSALDTLLIEHLAERAFLSVSPAARQLIGFAEQARQERLPFDALSGHWAWLLIGSLASSPSCAPQSRLARLAALVERSLDFPWTVREMTPKAGLSPGRLHAVFREEWDTTPQEWLTKLRIKKAQEWLAGTDRPISELAQAAGYSDQSALTKAMRRLTGVAPATYRKRLRESGTKKQE